MKKIFKISMILAAVISLAACHPNGGDNDVALDRDIYYTMGENSVMAVLGGGGTTVHLNTVGEWDALLDRFCDYTHNGGQVMFCGTSGSSAKGAGSKAPSTIVTADRTKLKEWMKEMEKAGRTVVVTYDDDNGTWNGMSYTNFAPQNEGAEAQTCTGTLVFTAVPALDQAPLAGAAMALHTDDGSDLILTVHGMMIVVEDASSVLLPDSLTMTCTGVVSTFFDLNNESFTTLEISEIEADVVIL